MYSEAVEKHQDGPVHREFSSAIHHKHTINENKDKVETLNKTWQHVQHLAWEQPVDMINNIVYTKRSNTDKMVSGG